LFLTKGYETTSIQVLIDAIGIAKGTFYHHFRSKVEVLEALTDSIALADYQHRKLMVESKAYTSLQKINLLFGTEGLRESPEELKAVIAMTRVMYSDENALLRDRILHKNMKLILPLVTQILSQGVQEGFFRLPDPQGAARMIIVLLGQMKSDAGRMLLTLHTLENPKATIIKMIDLFQWTVERLLGTQPGQIQFAQTLNNSTIIDLIIETLGGEHA